jgi:SAM-dependent methyltransferase
MTAYEGRHAELYDLFYASKDYAAEAQFVHDCLVRFSTGSARRVVDLACGTGRHAVALERLQHELSGVDSSESMLRMARANAAAANAQAKFHLGDLRSLDVPGAPFDVAVCLFDSIGYVRTNEGLEHAFRGIHRSLRPGGLLIFEFWHAAAMLRGHEPVRVRRWETPGGEVLRLSETRLDCERQLAEVEYSVYEHGRDGTFSSFRETQINRYFLAQEMAHWLSSTGFSPLGFFDGYSFEGRVTAETWHIVAVARRENGNG